MENDRLRTIVTIIFLGLTILWLPLGFLGVIFMWAWTSWPRWIKLLITLPFILFFVLFVLIIVGVFSSVFHIKPVQYSGTAMSPTYPDGANLFTTTAEGNEIKRGDIVLVTLPVDTKLELVERVVGLPNEKILLKDGDIYINEGRVEEKYLNGEKTGDGEFLKEGEEVTIPDGNYFVLGDNRPHSLDSREFGFIPKENIISQVKFCYWNCR